MKRLLRMLAVAGVIALVSTALFGCGQGDQEGQEGGEGGEEAKGQVELGYVEWDSEIASTNVVKKVLEDQGYEVKITAVDAGIMWTGIGNGDFDGIVAAWLPGTHGDYYEKVKDNVENLGPNLDGAKIGLAVPAYMDINSIDELNSVKDELDGEIIGIEPGAGIMSATEKAIEDYSLDLNLKDSSTAAMTATLKSKIENEEAVVVTEWTPHWPFAAWDLKYLEDPEGSYGGEEHIATIVRPGLKEEMPEVYKILDNFYWSPKDMETVMLNTQEGLEPAEAAAQWIENNQDKVSKWVE